MSEIDELRADIIALSMSTDLLWELIAAKSGIPAEDCAKVIDRHLLALEESLGRDGSVTGAKRQAYRRIQQLLHRNLNSIQRAAAALAEFQNRQSGGKTP